MIQDSPSHETPEFLWPAGVQVLAAGRVTVTLDLIDSSIEFTVRGLSLRGMDQAVVTANVTNTWFDSLRSDGIGMTTGFACSGLDNSTKVAVNCSKLAPAPLSDARVVLNADRFRFTDTRRHGQLNNQAAIEPVAYDQGRSTIEVHVERSDLTGAAAPAMFTYYAIGRPVRDIMDLGCVNPAPDANRSRSRGLPQARIHERGRQSHLRQRPEPSVCRDRPAGARDDDGAGKLLGRPQAGGRQGGCPRRLQPFVWSGNQKEDPPPFKAVPEARCELYNIPSQGNPTAIDGRFHLASDPRPPERCDRAAPRSRPPASVICVELAEVQPDQVAALTGVDHDVARAVVRVHVHLRAARGTNDDPLELSPVERDRRGGFAGVACPPAGDGFRKPRPRQQDPATALAVFHGERVVQESLGER